MKPLSKAEWITLISGVIIVIVVILAGITWHWFSPDKPTFETQAATSPTGTSTDQVQGAQTSSLPASTSTSMDTNQGTQASGSAALGKNISTNPGIAIYDTKVGTGATATSGSHVYVNYTGTLTDGTKFDSSYDRGQPIDFTLGAGQVIPGWDIGIEGMKVGGTRHLVIQPSLGYGAQAVGPIPANSVLVFDVELVKVQ